MHRRHDLVLAHQLPAGVGARPARIDAVGRRAPPPAPARAARPCTRAGGGAGGRRPRGSRGGCSPTAAARPRRSAARSSPRATPGAPTSSAGSAAGSRGLRALARRTSPCAPSTRCRRPRPRRAGDASRLDEVHAARSRRDPSLPGGVEHPSTLMSSGCACSAASSVRAPRRSRACRRACPRPREHLHGHGGSSEMSVLPAFAIHPPSTITRSPVWKRDSSLMKYTPMPSKSSGVPIRPIGL